MSPFHSFQSCRNLYNMIKILHFLFHVSSEQTRLLKNNKKIKNNKNGLVVFPPYM